LDRSAPKNRLVQLKASESCPNPKMLRSWGRRG